MCLDAARGMPQQRATASIVASRKAAPTPTAEDALVVAPLPPLSSTKTSATCALPRATQTLQRQPPLPHPWPVPVFRQALPSTDDEVWRQDIPSRIATLAAKVEAISTAVLHLASGPGRKHNLPPDVRNALRSPRRLRAK